LAEAEDASARDDAVVMFFSPAFDSNLPKAIVYCFYMHPATTAKCDGSIGRSLAAVKGRILGTRGGAFLPEKGRAALLRRPVCDRLDFQR
jgi:hypothetical protein